MEISKVKSFEYETLQDVKHLEAEAVVSFTVVYMNSIGDKFIIHFFAASLYM